MWLRADRAAPTACAALFVGALFAGLAGQGETLVAPLRAFVVQLAEAHYAMQRASAFVNAEGRTEFALLPDGDAGRSALRTFVAARPGWHLREAGVAGWLVVETPKNADAPLAALRAEDFTRVALRNRGLWICH